MAIIAIIVLIRVTLIYRILIRPRARPKVLIS
jgi:hypothetical protein